MNVERLINLLSDMDPDAEVCLGIDSDWGETELHILTIDDLVLANTYIAFQVPNNRRNDNDR
ncbi:hypothetical protein EBR25_12880 [bacterium]|jgi:hypothetical protein|nr:hypothetical protein [bacterium]